MEPLDIEAIIKKYSTPYAIENLNTNEGMGDGNIYQEQKEGPYLSSYESWGQNKAH